MPQKEIQSVVATILKGDTAADFVKRETDSSGFSLERERKEIWLPHKQRRSQNCTRSSNVSDVRISSIVERDQ